MVQAAAADAANILIPLSVEAVARWADARSAQQCSNSQCQHCRIHFCASSDGCHGWQPPTAEHPSAAGLTFRVSFVYFTLISYRTAARPARHSTSFYWHIVSADDTYISAAGPSLSTRQRFCTSKVEYRIDAVFEGAKQPACIVRLTNFVCLRSTHMT